MIKLQEHQARLYVRGSSKNGYKSYGIPLTKTDLGMLGLVEPKGQQVYLAPLSNGKRGLTVSVDQEIDSNELIYQFMQNLDRDVSFWLRSTVDDFDDPMWYNALSAMLKLLVLVSSYQLATGSLSSGGLDEVDSHMRAVLINSQQTELSDTKMVLQTMQWLSKVKPAMIRGLITRVPLMERVDQKFVTLRALYQEMINQYFSFSAMASSEKTQRTLIDILQLANQDPQKMQERINKIYKGVM